MFQQAISHSGSGLSPWAWRKNPGKVAARIAEMLGCPPSAATTVNNNNNEMNKANDSSELLQCLRERNASDLLAAADNLEVFKQISPVRIFDLKTVSLKQKKKKNKQKKLLNQT
jgi:hypothetical protein